ncbi:Cox family DNA-binding protein [Salmonella enterica]|uniref:Cox family DNA-binding protein n=1 Tax=Salmonella enterica TaxID=28901 RepID=UPI0009B130C8|nr:Cox family DNA-binding protein [Salmonella enterica]EAB9751148.1 regulator [Salmonella enterica subsp. salamae]EBW9942556.1 regulator [Salmonella enterica subsp. enterica serovar Give]EBZ2217574.1 regulator [Salmonella enterica subsp. enterica serovar Montevideo]ECA5181621.1 regulator [Salmonella enterica subsp. enterica serovar Newport]ECB3943286.1 regulator [Salmonella enterica subsp. enterica serovar Stanley]ECD3768839.1 regulator [Salmonella enterica subsp. enterica serovar Onderstepoo
MRNKSLEGFIELGYPLTAVPAAKFAEMIGKSVNAVSDMIRDGKLPVIPMKNPESTSNRAENWIYIPEFNEVMREAYFNRPKEQRDAWKLWLGLR